MKCFSFRLSEMLMLMTCSVADVSFSNLFCFIRSEYLLFYYHVLGQYAKQSKHFF